MSYRMCFIGIAVLFITSGVLAQSGLQRVWAVDDGERIKQTALNHPLRTSQNNRVWSEETQTISLFGARNEFVAFQLIIEATSSGASNVNVQFDSLRKSDPPSFTISNQGWNGDPYNYVNRHIEMFVMHYMNIDQRTNESFTGWSSGRAGAAGDPVWSSQDFLGWHGEQLVPFEAAAGPKSNGQGGAPFAIQANRLQSVWVDIYIPRTAPPGNYTGTITITENGADRFTRAVNLKVYDFALSDSTHIWSVGLFDDNELSDRHRIGSTSNAAFHAMIKRYMQFGRRHRVNLQRASQSPQSHWQHLKEAYTGELFTANRGYYGPSMGMSPEKFYIGVWDQPRIVGNSDKGYKSGFGDVQRILASPTSPDTNVWKQYWYTASRMWADSFALYAPYTSVERYGAEEVTVNGGSMGDTSAFFDLRRKQRWLVESGSGIKYVNSDNFNPWGRERSLAPGAGTYDISTGQAGYINQNYGANVYPAGMMVDSVIAWRALGIPLSFYSGTRPSTGNDMIDSPPIDWRMRTWMMWKLDIQGYRIWQVNKGGSDYNAWHRDKRFTEGGGKWTWGDGTLIYAGQEKSQFIGDDRGLAGPIGGVRLKNWRRAVQDYQYLKLAQQHGLNTTAIVSSIVNKVGNELVQNQPVPLDGWAQRGYQYEQARRQLADMIEGAGIPFPTGTLTATPDTLLPGGGLVTLSWSSQHATSASIDNGIGAVPVNGSIHVNVSTSTIFRLTLTNGAGSQVISVPVTVSGTVIPPSGTFIVTPEQLPAGGGEVTLIWVSHNALSASLDNGIGSVALNGSLIVQVNQSTTYRLLLANAVDSITLEAGVTVASPLPTPSGTFIATPDSLPAGGGNTTLFWISENASSASLDNGIGQVPLNGSHNVNVTTSTVYTLTLSNSTGSQVLTAPVSVAGTPPPPSGTFSATPDTLPPGGGNVTLVWSSQNATSAEIDNGIGPVAINGSLNVTVATTTSYRLSLTNGVGTQQLTITIIVEQDTVLPTGTFVVTPDSLSVGGGEVTLVWVSQNATSASIDNGVGSVPPNGSINVQVSQPTTFVLTLRNSIGNTPLTASVVVGGLPPVPAGTLVAVPDSLPAGGGTSTLVWVSSHATTATLDHGIGPVPVNGSLNVNLASPRTYRLTLTNQSGSFETSVSIKVGNPTPLPQGTFVAVPDTLPPEGGNTTLIWVSTNAASASIDHGIGVVQVNGFLTRLVTASALFRLTLENSSGTRILTAPVVVRGSLPTPPTGSLSAQPDTLPEGGGEVVLSWNSEGADSAFIDQGIGPVPVNGLFVTTVGSSRTYTIRFFNAGGSNSYSASVFVPTPSAGPVDITFGGTPTALVMNPTGTGSQNIETIRDGLTPPPGSTNPQEQYDTYDGNHQKTFDWVGYTFAQPQVFSGLMFQEGIHFPDGGWLDTLHVQVKIGELWKDVDRLLCSPAYAGNNGMSYEQYDLTFTPVAASGIRIGGKPGGMGRYFSVGELRALRPWNAVTPKATFVSSASNVSPAGGYVTLHWSVANASAISIDNGIGDVTPTGSVTVLVTQPRTFTLSAGNGSTMEQVSVAIGMAAPVDYTLEANYPNPFNPSTNIRFAVHTPVIVSLKVFDILGREIRTLFSGLAEPGITVVEWDGTNDNGLLQASGTYIYRLVTDSFTEAKRMVLMK